MRASLPVSSLTASSGKLSSHWFARFAAATANWTGTTTAFVIAVAIVCAWAVTGPLFNYSDTWQLVINTGTTIVTFLMVFLIQNTQNRDTKALQIKLSELILALETANNRIAAIESASPEELEAAQEEIQERVGNTPNTEPRQEKTQQPRKVRKHQAVRAIGTPRKG
jgi:low affinity Fe/Cu permease